MINITPSGGGTPASTINGNSLGKGGDFGAGRGSPKIHSAPGKGGGNQGAQGVNEVLVA